jgi:dTMP kinase
MRGKLIVVEGTDCSGKETQTLLLERKLNDLGIKSKRLSFPMYDTPTGQIVATCYLGKEQYCDYLFKDGIRGLFKEGASNVDYLTSSLYYAADRRYNSKKIKELLDEGTNVILDRYIYSNLAHQGGKITNDEERSKYFSKMEQLEFDILEIPKPDKVIFLYVPYKVAEELVQIRKEGKDQHEENKDHLINAEKTYFELADLYNFDIINCAPNDKIRTIKSISDELYSKVEFLVKKK